MSRLDLSALGPVLQEMLMGDTVRISRPAGPPVLNPETGELEPVPPHVVYEGPGAVYDSSQAPGVVTPLAGQPYPDDPKNPYRLLTPTIAPIAERDDTITVVHASQDPTLVGRSWRCVQPSGASSLLVVRVTWLDENNETETR
ncbi:DUF6093 family protein [Streptomyces sp. Edi4]|uniref:DUF6093 family protein n=1 Tax=Streptomyces sp. Edi4 TaxID=3162527 RepID=UPI003305B5EC